MNEEIGKLLDREQLQLAPVRKRALAALIDEMLMSTMLIIVLWDAFTQANTLEDMILLTNTFVLEYMAMKIVYQTFFVYQYGATLGKMVMHVSVIELSTLMTPTLLSAFNRAVFRIISEMIFYLGFLWGLLDPSRQTWHDKTARTVVVDA